MHYYFCDNDKHTRQVLTKEDSPVCTCGAVMTYGRFTHKYDNFLTLKPGVHETIDGKKYTLRSPITAC